MSSNYPPGVTGSEPEIIGNIAWENVHQTIDDDATQDGMTDMDVFVAWRLGLAAWKRAKDLGAQFPHDADL